MKRFLCAIFLSLVCCWPAAAKEASPTKAAIASAHYLATDAGQEVLTQGGNVFDAAVAVAAALAVVEPSSSGLGGGAFFLVGEAKKGKDQFVDAREVAPAAFQLAAFLDANGKFDPGKSTVGALAAGIPGQPAGLVHISQHFGRLPLRTSLAPAIRLAEQGFPVSQRLINLLTMRLAVLKAFPDAAAIFLDHGEMPAPGYVIKQPELAKTLRLLANRGHAGFYQGETAEKLVAGVKKAGGTWQLADLRDYAVKVRSPLQFSYQDYRIITAPPPSAGGIALATMLNILSAYPLTKWEQSLQNHALVESMRRAYRDRSIYLGDPDFVDVPASMLISPYYAAGLRASINLEKATPSQNLATDTARAAGNGTDTTHFSIIDDAGNRIAATLSINLPFGSCFIPPGTGVILNNEMDDFSMQANAPNAYGLVGGGNANAPAPRKRMLSSMTPTFIIGRGKTAAIGTPGGSRIPTMVLLGLLGFMQGKSTEEIVRLPRIHHQFMPDAISAEKGALSSREAAELRAKGHAVSDGEPQWGNMNMVILNKKTGALSGGADPRGLVGKTMVYRKKH